MSGSVLVDAAQYSAGGMKAYSGIYWIHEVASYVEHPRIYCADQLPRTLPRPTSIRRS